MNKDKIAKVLKFIAYVATAVASFLVGSAFKHM